VAHGTREIDPEWLVRHADWMPEGQHVWHVAPDLQLGRDDARSRRPDWWMMGLVGFVVLAVGLLAIRRVRRRLAH